MSNLWRTLARQWQDAINFLLGLWLIASPWVLNYRTHDYATWNAYVLGIIIVVAALSTLVDFHEWEEWVSLAFGAWLFVSPWVLGFTTIAAAMWNMIVVGVVVAGMAAWSIWNMRHLSPAT